MALGRFVIGSVAAGAVIIAVNVLAQVVLGERVQREMDAWMPGVAARMNSTGAAVAAGVAMKLAIGGVLVALDALVRPRVASRLGAAASASLVVWTLGAIFFSDFPLTGMLSWTTYALLEALQLFAFVAAACAGAWLYRGPRGGGGTRRRMGQPARRPQAVPSSVRRSASAAQDRQGSGGSVGSAQVRQLLPLWS